MHEVYKVYKVYPVGFAQPRHRAFRIQRTVFFGNASDWPFTRTVSVFCFFEGMDQTKLEISKV